jgi:putative phosphoesterase
MRRRAMQIGIMSDSHDHHDNVLRAVDIFNDHEVDYVLHAGDIISPFTARAFAALKTRKFVAVFGNNEGEKLFLKSTIESFGGEIHEYCYKGQIGGKHIYMTHTDHHVEEVATSQMYDILIYGHTHKQDIRQVGKTLVINPGETTDWLTGSPQVMIVNLDDMSYRTEKIVSHA